jgi:hypothetical protein
LGDQRSLQPLGSSQPAVQFELHIIMTETDKMLAGGAPVDLLRRGEAERVADLLLSLGLGLLPFRLLQYAGGGFPGSPIVFDARTDLDSALSGQFVDNPP